MTQTIITLDKFTKKLATLDKHTKQFSTAQKAEYEKKRQQFIARLSAWRSRAETEAKEQKQNLEEGYNELEATLHRLTKQK